MPISRIRLISTQVRMSGIRAQLAEREHISALLTQPKQRADPMGRLPAEYLEIAVRLGGHPPMSRVIRDMGR